MRHMVERSNNFIDRLFGKRTRNIVHEIPEHISGLPTFSPEQSLSLERMGYVIYQLTGHSVATLRNSGNLFFSLWHKGEAFENEPSMRTEVAVNSRALFLPHSNRKNLSEQQNLISQFNEKIMREVPGVIAKLGGVSDYAELSFLHENVTRERLFGSKYNFNYTRTITPTDSSHVATVGDFRAHGLRISYCPNERGDAEVWVALLIVPESAR